MLTVDEWRNPAYRAYLRENGYCAACMKIAAMIAFGRRIDPAHGPVNGMRQKGPDCECIPLCRHHHQEQHRIGWAAFEVKYGFSRAAQAKLWWQSFQRHESQTKSKA